MERKLKEILKRMGIGSVAGIMQIICLAFAYHSIRVMRLEFEPFFVNPRFLVVLFYSYGVLLLGFVLWKLATLPLDQELV